MKKLLVLCLLAGAGVAAVAPGSIVLAHGDHESHSGPYVNNPEPTTSAEAAIAAEVWWAHVGTVRFADQEAARDAEVEATGPTPEPTPEPETPAPAPAPEPVVPPTGHVVEASCSGDKRFSNLQAGKFASTAEYCDWIARAATLEAEFYGKLPRNFFPEGGPAGWDVMRHDRLDWTPLYYTDTTVKLYGTTTIGYFNPNNFDELPPESYYYTPEKFLTAVQGVGGCRHGAASFDLYGPASWDGICQLGSGQSIHVNAGIGSIDIRFYWQLPR